MRKWRGVLCVEGVQTGDGRFIVEGATTWRDLPFALKPGHDTEDSVGNVATVTRVGNDITATGVFDDTTPIGKDMARMIDEGTAPGGNRWGLSIEPDDIEVEIIDTRPPAEDGATEELIVVASGSKAKRRFLRAAAGGGEPEGDVVYTDSTDSVMSRYTRLRISAVALVPVPALDGAYLEFAAATDPHDWVDANGDGKCDVCGLDKAGHDAEQQPAENQSLLDEIVNAPVVDLTAAARVPLKPPRDWFYEPEPSEGDPRLVPQYDIDSGDYIGDAVPLYIGDDGQVYGHVAPANRCHVGFDGVCVTPPASASAYSHFHVGYTVTDQGDVHTGVLCAGCDHAAILGLDEKAARDWYANIGFGWAHVRVTPGRYGPWACGALRPGVTDELVYALRGGGISGDWRGDDRGLELIGVLAVNVPGFTVQRALAATAGSVRIPNAQSAMRMQGNDLRFITAPVMRAAPSSAHEHNGTCDKCGSAQVNEELRLARETHRMVRSIFTVEAGPREKAKLASRFRGGRS